jgi:hypothetical protein
VFPVKVSHRRARKAQRVFIPFDIGREREGVVLFLDEEFFVLTLTRSKRGNRSECPMNEDTEFGVSPPCRDLVAP